jgi:transcriptional regulator with XRE-family HTH domain
VRKNLRKARLENKLTQAELAELIGLTRMVISHLENARYDTRPRTWDKLEEILKVPQKDLRKVS